jgi:hypothetical protein
MSLYGSLAVRQSQVGKIVAFGTHTPVSASDEVITGLSECEFVVVSMQGAQSLTHMWTTALPSVTTDGSITIVTEKPTSSSNYTPDDASTPWTAVDWVAIGS